MFPSIFFRISRGLSAPGVALATILAAMSCAGAPAPESPVTSKHLTDISKPTREALASRRIYFGHQSVGGNILDGIRDLVTADPSWGVKIEELGDRTSFPGPEFVHSKIGKNGDPAGKTEAFARLVDGGLAEDGAILFHKYCYGDFWDPSGPKVADVFERYKATMARLRRDHPGVVFVHVTIPLPAPRLGLKTQIKKLLGGEIGEYDNNVRNDEFNALMRGQYAGKEPLFDLARVEATRPDGTLQTISYRGRSYETLVPEYTYDDGHLNEKGRRWVAEQLLVFLAGLPGRP